MMIRIRLSDLAAWVALAILVTACGRATPVTADPDAALATIVAETMSAAQTDAAASPQVSDTPEPEVTGTPTQTFTPTNPSSPVPTQLVNNVSGKVCFPDGEVPPMTAYFEETETEELVELPISGGQESYAVKIPPGTYIAYTWLTDFTRGGLYSHAVPCGLKAGCDDHSMLPFTIKEGELLEDIDLCDWFAGPFNVPYPPGKPQEEVTGGVSGDITYIEDSLPELRVFAFSVTTGYWYWIYTQEGQSSFTISELPPGVYHLVAYDPDGRAGGHASADHQLIDVNVKSGETTQDVNITDWDAPAGTFPADPTR